MYSSLEGFGTSLLFGAFVVFAIGAALITISRSDRVTR